MKNMRRPKYFIENGKLMCDDGIFDEPYEVLCSVEQFIMLLDEDGWSND